MALNCMVSRFTLNNTFSANQGFPIITSPTNTTGYSHLSIITHWLGAILVIALFATQEGEPGDAMYVLHVSFGAIAGLFLLWRVWHRVCRGFTDKPDQAEIYDLASRIVIWGFLVCIVLVIVSGYFLPWSLGRPLDVFGIEIPSPIGRSHGLHELMEELHEITGILIMWLLALNFLGAAKDYFIDKDAVLQRRLRPVHGGK